MLAMKVLSEGGAVCAVGYSDDCKECLHKIIRTPEGLDDLRRAKFVQSKKYDVFSEVKKILMGGGKFAVLRNTMRSRRFETIPWKGV